MRVGRAALALLVCLASIVASDHRALATVTTSSHSVTYEPAAPTTVYSITFPAVAKNQIRVRKQTISSGVYVTLTQGTDYTVVLPAGSVAGSVTLAASVSAGYRVVIDRQTPLTQATSFRTQGAFRPSAHEDALDKLTMVAQEISDGTTVSTDITDAIATHSAESDPHTAYVRRQGRSGGQVVCGGENNGELLQLRSTNAGTPGKIYFGNTGNTVLDEVNDRWGLGTATPSYKLHVVGDSYISTSLVTPLLYGKTTAAGYLQLISTTNATKGKIYFGEAATSAFNELNGRLGIGTAAPSYAIHAIGDIFASVSLTSPLATLTTKVTSPAVYGGVSASDTLLLSSTSHGTKGTTSIGAADVYVDEVNHRLGVLDSTPDAAFDVAGAAWIGASNQLKINGDDAYKSDDTAGFRIYGGTTATTAASIALYGPSHGTDPDEIVLWTDGVSIRDINTSTDVANFSSTVNFLDAPLWGARHQVSDAAFAETVTATLECNKVFLAATDGTIVTLPDAAAGNKGCEVTVINSGADGAALVTIQPDVGGAGDSIYGSCVGITGAGAATVVQSSGTAKKGWNNTKATANKGDYTKLVSDGSAGWYITGCVGEWASTP